MFLDDWSHIGDPRQLVTLVRTRVKALGASFFQANAARLDISDRAAPALVLQSGGAVSARQVVVAAGAWSATRAQSIGDPVLLDSERGYNTTLPRPGVHLSREVIFAECKFVATPLDIGIRIGGLRSSPVLWRHRIIGAVTCC